MKLEIQDLDNPEKISNFLLRLTNSERLRLAGSCITINLSPLFRIDADISKYEEILNKQIDYLRNTILETFKETIEHFKENE